MSFKRTIGLCTSVAVVVAITSYGCSSSSGDNSNGPNDSGSDVNSGKDTGNKDTGGSTDTGGGGDSSGDDGGPLNCPPMDTSGFKAPTYVPAVANQGACSAQDIAMFVTACGDNSTNATCGAWQTANVASDAGPGTACGKCIFSPMNNGGTWTDPNNFFLPNYAGCIQLTDMANGAACGAALNNIQSCEGVACDQCSNTDYGACTQAADKGGCSMFASTFTSACMSDRGDGGAFQTCAPGAASNMQNPDFTYIIGLICGGGPSDAGGGG